MRNEEQYLKLGEYESYSRVLRHLFDCDRRLPEAVFRTKMDHYLFFEFDFMISPDFWNVINVVARFYSDAFVVVSVVDPDPIQYFYKEFSRCGAFMLSNAADKEVYFSFLEQSPPGSPADALLFNSSIVTWTGAGSDRWAIWGEREVGIGVLGAMGDLSHLFPHPQNVTQDLAIGLAVHNLRLTGSAAARFSGSILQNYPAS